MKIDRKKFLTETMLRIKIQKMLKEKRERKLQYLKEQREEKELRKAVRRHLISEAKKSSIPYDSTGISVLADTIKKINPIIRDDYINLTTDVDQRRSFRAHIINGFKNAIAPLRALDKNPDAEDLSAPLDDEPDEPGVEDDLMASPKAPPEGATDVSTALHEQDPMDDIETPEQGSEDLSVDIDKDGIPDAEDRFIETDPDREKEEKKPDISPEEQEKEEFLVQGEDTTGRNMALETFKKIEKNITDAYSLLSNQKDKDEFYKWGIINLKLHFDRWEEDLQGEIEEYSP